MAAVRSGAGKAPAKSQNIGRRNVVISAEAHQTLAELSATMNVSMGFIVEILIKSLSETHLKRLIKAEGYLIRRRGPPGKTYHPAVDITKHRLKSK